MKLIFLGSGSAFTTGKNNYHSNMLLEIDGKQLLIDCGSDCRFSLHEQGFSYKDIKSVYISHLHGDHVGGLEWLSFTTKFDKTCKKPELYIEESIAKDLWNHVLAGALNSVGTKADLDTFFKVHLIKKNLAFKWQGIDLKLTPTDHCCYFDKIMPTWGLFFTLNGKKVWISGDTKLSTELHQKYYDEAEIIFHDCEVCNICTDVHARYEELLKLPKKIRDKMWLYHYSKDKLPDAVKDGFRGFVLKGQTFLF